ncbi:MAG: MFS transporter [Shinella sp.]|nr:MAG: MFS transporter [Shinella sp.]
MKASDERPPHLLAYALPAIPLAVMALPFYVVVPTFYAQSLGLSAAGLGLVLLLIRILDALSDPLVGWLSDRSFLRTGRRRSFFILFVPLTAFCTFKVFWPPADADLLYLGIWGAALSFCYTGVTLPYTAWGAELSPDYDGRSVVSAFREGATLVGTLLAVVLPFAVGIDRTEGVHGLAAVALLVVILLPFTAILAVWKVPEPANLTSQRLRLVAGLRLLAGNRPFVRLIAAFFLNGFANAIPATLFLYFVSERLGLPELRGPFLFLYFACGMIGVPVAVVVARRVGKHRAWCGAMIAACLIFGLAGFLGQGDGFAFGIICALTGVLLGFDLALPPAIQADVIDNDTMISGEQRSGLYFAAWGLATKLSLAASAGLVFPLLEWSGFLMTGSVEQTSGALSTLSGLYAWLPVLPKLAAIVLMWSFPLGRDQQRHTRDVLERGGRSGRGTGA